MGKKEKMIIAAISVAVIILVIVMLALSGFDISGIRIRSGFHVGA